MTGLLNMLAAPMDAGAGDRIVGYDEAGNPVYETLLGGSYTVKPRMSDEAQRRIDDRDLVLSQIGAGRPIRLAEGDGRTDIGNPEDALLALLSGALDGVTAPGRAAAGEPVSLGDVWSTALDWGVMGPMGKAPDGALRMFAARDGGTIDDAVEFSRSQNAIFHSGHAPVAEDLHRYGVEPDHGPWVREVLAGAVDDVDAHLDGVPAASWWDSQPQWVKAKVARAAEKYVDDVTVEDIRRHGHLIIADASEYSDDLYRIPQRGVDNGEHSRVETWAGDDRRLYETPLYQYDDAAMAGRYTEGLEPNDIVTTETIDPLFSLTGDELVEFLQKRGDISGQGSAPSRPGITAYHGSPHDFDRFSMDKIGTGEGAQDLGRGLYFYDEEAPAALYKNPAARWGDVDAMARYSEAGPGRIYEVNINARPDQILDVETPMANVPEGGALAKARDARIAAEADPEMAAIMREHMRVKNMPGDLTGAAAADGYVGFKRRRYGGETEMSIFDENLIEIVRKYGIAGAAAMLGLSVQEVEDRLNGA